MIEKSGMKLYLVHCGYYDKNICDGVYEQHVNFFVAAADAIAAKAAAKRLAEYKMKSMHVDGIQEVRCVDGHEIRLEPNPELKGETQVVNVKHRSRMPAFMN